MTMPQASAAADAPTAPADQAPSTRHQCPNCQFIYEDALGYPREGFPPGTAWASLPADWSCPHCAVRDKQDFAAL